MCLRKPNYFSRHTKAGLLILKWTFDWNSSYAGHASHGCLVWNIKCSNSCWHSNSPLIFLVLYPFYWVHLSPNHFSQPTAISGLARCFCCRWIFKQLMKAKEESYVFLLTVGMFYSERFFTAVRCSQEINICGSQSTDPSTWRGRSYVRNSESSLQKHRFVQQLKFGIMLYVSEPYVCMYPLKLKF
jgi:hypothetical protein